MEQLNPYQAPRAALEDQAPDHFAAAPLADRSVRFWASIIDTLTQFALAMVVMALVGSDKYLALYRFDALTATVVTAFIGFMIFTLVNGFFLLEGQTVGKKLLGIRIVSLDGRIPRLWRLLVLRYLPMSAVSILPILGNILLLIDVLFIFRSDARCVHDLIAGTKVVKVRWTSEAAEAEVAEVVLPSRPRKPFRSS